MFINAHFDGLGRLCVYKFIVDFDYYAFAALNQNNTHQIHTGIKSWTIKTYDSFGNNMSYKDSRGGWYRYTRDSTGEVVTYKSSVLG